jgi:rod shape-determining protein MreC
MKRFLQDNGGLLLLAAVLLAAVLALGSFILGFDPITGVAEAVAAPFRAASTAVADWVQGWYDRGFRYTELEAENETLRQRVADLEQAAREGEDAVRENERLRDLLGLAEERPEFTYEEATVTRRSSSNWTYDLTINKGSSSGVAVNDCVIDQYGNLVGVVAKVGVNWAQVTTVIDPDLELGGRIARTDDDAIVEGDFTLMLEGLTKLTYLPADAQLVSGDQVTTSGLGGVYPAGLMVGTIRGVYTQEDGLSRYAQVEPAADVAGVRYVYVITGYGA